MIKVSVILPVYNVAPYLRECLDSLVHQTLSDIEIICVDDGSTDESVRIIQEYCEKDPRIQILFQENQGAGVARNTGIAVAQGKYLSFLDPDDFFEHDMLEILFQKGEETEAEIVICDIFLYDNLEKTSYRSKNYFCQEKVPKKEVFSLEDCADFFICSSHAAWNKLFNRKFIIETKILFQALFRCNDVYFSFCTQMKAKKITTVNMPLLYYRTNLEKSFRKELKNYPMTLYTAFIAIQDFIIQESISKKIQSCFSLYVLESMVTFLLTETRHYEGFRQLYEKLHTSFERDFFISQLKEEDITPYKWKEYQKIKAIPFQEDYFLYYRNKPQEIREKLREIREKESELCFFGAGHKAKVLLRLFQENNIPYPVAICDNKESLWGTDLKGVPICSIRQALVQYPKMAVFIAALDGQGEIQAQLSTQLPNSKIYQCELYYI